MSKTHILGLFLGAGMALWLVSTGAPLANAVAVDNEGLTCVGGTVIGRESDYTDGVDYTFGMYGPEEMCNNIAGGVAGVCCAFDITANDGGQAAYPVGVRMQMTARVGATVATTSCPGRYHYVNNITRNCFVVESQNASSVTASLVANPLTVYAGEQSLVSWGSTGATSCMGTNFETGGAVSGSVLVTPAVTTEYQVACVQGTQRATASRTVTVVPRGDHGGGGGGGGGGGDTQCSDGVDNDNDGDVDLVDRGCSGSGDTSEGTTGSGVVPQCADGIDNNGDGVIDFPDDQWCASQNDALELVEPAGLTLNINPPLIKKNQSCTITLSATNVTQCSLTGPRVSQTFTATNGFVSESAVVTPSISVTTTYTLSCAGVDGKTVTKNVDCKIAPTFQEI